MVKLESFQTETYEYTSILEMMSHVKTMGDAGWTLISSNHISKRCTYKKDLS